MTPEWFRRIEEVFDAAADASTEERGAVLDRLCRDDAALRAEVEALLAVSPRAAREIRGAIEDLAGEVALGETALQPVGVHVLPAQEEVGGASAQGPLGTRIGQYELIRLLGRGGMGEVHLARDLRLGRLVAIKLLITQRSDLDERFLAEAQATARCHHENIVVIHEVGMHRGQPYMVLEYLEGQTLRQWLNDRGVATGSSARVPPARTVELMLPVVRALAYAHEQGIVHRDLKPENVMLTRAGVTKVLDFGIAKRVAASSLEPDATGGDAGPATKSSSLAGTIPYMAPEQVRLGAIDHRTDIWAAGIMLFELVAGTRPVSEAPALLLALIADGSTPMPSASGRVADLGPLGAIIDRCLIKDPAHRTASARVLLAELEALASGRRAVAVGDGGNPFAGLAAFQEADAGRFFGRDRDIEQVVAELRSRALVAVVGPSGLGKSSLVRAGVIPALKRSGEGWDAHIVRPGREPLAALAGILAHLDSAPAHGAAGTADGEGASRAVLEQMCAEPGYLGARLRARATNKRRRIALFVDQLEELYTLGAPAAERTAFLACLAAVADDAISPLRVLVSMRSDFLDRLTEDRRLGAEVTRGLVLLPAMDREGMREALLRPMQASEHRFEPAGLVDRMVDAVAGAPGALPLLQFTAARLWERRDRDRRLLTEASYEELGGVAGALATHADTVLAGMPMAQQALARAVLERLVTPERTRAPVSVAELRALRRDPEEVDGFLQHLTAMRLVVIERGAEDADPTVELVHESLIDRWPTLVRWLNENQGDAAILGRLRAAARDWERSGHAAGLLWSGEVAREVREWRQRYGGELAPVEQRYLAAVLAAADRARGVRRMLFGAVLTTAVVVAIAMAWLAWRESQAGERAATEAMRARDATRMAALRALPGDPTAQLALLREIEDLRAPPPEAAREARRRLHAGVAPVVLTSPAGLNSAAFSPDGLRIVSASVDQMVRVWSADGRGEPLVLRGHENRVALAAFSPDGRRIVSASVDRTVRVWSADGRGEPLVLRGHGSDVKSAAFSPDGLRIVSASDDRTVRVWSADGRGEPLILRGHESTVTSAAFSPDGRQIVSTSLDRTVRVWSADGRGEPVILGRHDERITTAVFSPDGRRVVSASDDRTVRIWSADGRGEPVVLRGHDDRVATAAFSPDGRRIVSASHDGTVRIWNAERRPEPLCLRGHDGFVWSAVFSPDGGRIASASEDKTVRVWSADGHGEPLVLRHDGKATSAVFSPDGLRIASSSTDRTVRVWSADGRGEPLELRGHDDIVRSVAFSPDGLRIASASSDRTVRVWSADGHGEPLVLRGHEGFADMVAFSPDGRRIVSTSLDRTARVWSADGRGEPVILRGHDATVRSAMFSPDGLRIVSASVDRTVRVWSADGRGEPRVLRGHEDWVFWAEFSADGRRILSASRDKTIRIWRADGEGEPVILVGHELPVVQARFSPDGQRVVSASFDHTVCVWHELAPATLEDPRLWAATSYCMPIKRRIELLGVTEAQAGRDLQRCLERVEHARRAP